MQYFEYKTKNQENDKIYHGLITADNISSAEEMLKKRGENIVEISVMRDVFNIRKTLYTLTHKAGNKVKLEFFTMLNFMLESGLALYESLIGIRDSGNNKQLKNLTKRLADEVRKGAGLSLAMKKSGQFDDATVQQLKAGEESGQINETLKRMIFQLDHELEFKSKIKSAMIYPVIICVVMIVVLWVMMTMVVPTLAETLVSMGGELPLITKIVIASSNIMKMSTPFVIILIVIAIIGYKAGRRNDEFKYATDRLKLSIPIIGNMIEKIELSKFCRNLSAMQKSGITLVSSLKTVETAVKNSKIAKEIDKACRLVEISGMNLSVALSKTGNFPPLMLQLIEIGISSGQICDVLDRIALQYEKETNESLKRLTGLLEPSMIVISGCAVGLIVVSLMLPMFSMTDVIGV